MVTHGPAGPQRSATIWPEVIDDPVLMDEDLLGLGHLVLKDHAHPAVQVADHLQPLSDQLSIELGLGKNRRVGVEVDTSVPDPRDGAGLFLSACAVGLPKANCCSH